MPDLDPHAKDRATKLLKDARNGTWGNRTRHAFQSVKKSFQGWREDNGLASSSLESAIRVSVATGATVAGVVLASAVVVGTGVIATIATFGIAPALAATAGAIVKFGISEFKYQRGSSRLIKATSGGGEFGPELLVPAMAKVLRKYDWVKSRAYQFRGNIGKRISNVIMSPKQAVLGKFFKHKNYTHELFPRDEELDKRLLELRYYAQMSFNVVEKVIDEACKVRDQYAQILEGLYKYTIRQVHFSGHHENCGNRCYGIPEAEFLRTLKFYPQYASTISEAKLKAFEDEQKIKANATRSNTCAKTILRNLEKIGHAYAHETVEASELGEGVSDLVVSMARSKALAAAKISKIPTGGAKYSIQEGKNLMEVGGQKFVGQGGHLGGAALGAAAAGVAEIATERAMAFYRNRKLKRKIMRNKDAALGLLELTQQGEEEGENEIFSTIITKKNEFRKQLPRVAQKVVHYISKAHKTDEKAKEILKTIQTWQKEKKHSPFRSCEEAWDYNRAISYAFKNYNKFVTHMVYMEALLLQLDLKVSDRTNISQGKIVSEGKQWPKPPHMRAHQKDEEVEDEIEYTDNPLFEEDEIEYTDNPLFRNDA